MIATGVDFKYVAVTVIEREFMGDDVDFKIIFSECFVKVNQKSLSLNKLNFQ